MMNRVFNVPWTVLKITLLIVFIMGVAYLITCGVANFWPEHTIKIPDTEYEIFIKNTGQSFYSDHVEDKDNTVKMYGYYELIKDRYHYRGKDLILNRNDWGRIDVYLR